MNKSESNYVFATSVAVYCCLEVYCETIQRKRRVFVIMGLKVNAQLARNTNQFALVATKGIRKTANFVCEVNQHLRIPKHLSLCSMMYF